MVKISDVFGPVEIAPTANWNFNDDGWPITTILLSEQESNEFISFLKMGNWGHRLEKEYELQICFSARDAVLEPCARMPMTQLVDLMSEAVDVVTAEMLAVAKEWQSKGGDVWVTFGPKQEPSKKR